MSARSESIGHCHVVGGEKLPARAGGAAAVCSEIEHAVASAAPRARYAANVKVVSKSRLSASLVVNGRQLPEQNFAIMDSELDAGAIQRFAASLAGIVAEATKTSR